MRAKTVSARDVDRSRFFSVPKRVHGGILRPVARPRAAAFGFVLALGISGVVWADSLLQDVARAPASANATSNKFAGSFVEASTYVGTGTFYASGYQQPVRVARAVREAELRPRDAVSRWRSAARIYVEEESHPARHAQRRGASIRYDPWVWLAADNLHTFERSKIRIGGLVRTILPLSYESRYQHMLFGVGAGIERQP